MGPSDPQPDSTPAQTTDEATGKHTDAAENHRDTSQTAHGHVPVSRRGALAAMIGLGGLGLLNGSAQATHGGPHWRTDVDADGHDLFDLGMLDADVVQTPRFGTTDATALEGMVNDERFLRVEPTNPPSRSDRAPNILAGHRVNTATSGIAGATIGGGGQEHPTLDLSNTVEHDYTTIGGGLGNTASGMLATVGGGANNTASGGSATIPGGVENTASGSSSFAAGRFARASGHHTFVWNGEATPFEGHGDDLFLVNARNGVGIGTNTPQTQLHVTDEINAAADLQNHVAAIENTSEGDNADVLALKVNNPDPPTANQNYISFKAEQKDAEGDRDVGAIEGDGQGGITFKSGSGDFAEYFPKRDVTDDFEPGEVVGLRNGQLSRDTAGADAVFVVTDRPIVLGNQPPEDEEADHIPVALLGQVPVKVKGSVSAGDQLVTSGENDGMAITCHTAETDGLVVGRAQKSRTDDAGEVIAFVGGQIAVDPTEDAYGRQRTEDGGHDDTVRATVEELREENAALRERNSELEDRLDAIEVRLDGQPDTEPERGGVSAVRTRTNR